MSLADVLALDSGTDRNGRDFDLLEIAIHRVLHAKPSSPVALLTNADVALTAFLPSDAVFVAALDRAFPGRSKSEWVAAVRLRMLSPDAVERVLLRHFVAGTTLNRTALFAADGEEFSIAGGGTIRLEVSGAAIRLVDQDPASPDPRVERFDINGGQVQIGHRIDALLMSIDAGLFQH